MTVAQQEARQLLGVPAAGCAPPPDALAPLPGTMQLGEIDGVAPVRLDAIAWSARDQRWGDDHAAVARRRQLPLDPVAARPGFVTEAQRAAGARQLVGQLAQRFRRVGDLPVLAHLTALVAVGQWAG